MNATKLKSDFHKLIDGIHDEDVLQSFFGALNDYVNTKMKTDIMDELTEKQKKRLKQSIVQSKTGKIFTNEQMKLDIRQWLAK